MFLNEKCLIAFLGKISKVKKFAFLDFYANFLITKELGIKEPSKPNKGEICIGN